MSQRWRAQVSALVRLLAVDSMAVQTRAAAVLWNTLREGCARENGTVILAAIEDAEFSLEYLFRLMDGQSEHPGAAHAGLLLACLLNNSPAHFRSLLMVDRVVSLVTRLETSSVADVQAAAAGILSDIIAAGGTAARQAAADVGILDAAIWCLSSSSHSVLCHSARLLRVISNDSPERQHAIVDAGGVEPLASLLGCPRPDVVAKAAAALANLTSSEDSEARMAAIAELESDDICTLINLLATSSDAAIVESAAAIACHVIRDSAAAAQVIEAGGIAAMVRCLQDERFRSSTHQKAAWSLYRLACIGAQTSSAVAAARGVGALMQALARQPCSAALKFEAASALCSLLLHGQGDAVAAADPSNAAASALEALPSCPRFAAGPHWRGKVAEALRLLAEARRSMHAARVCAAPGCGATSGLRRCAGCATVRYCSEACLRAHWKEHRPECRQLRAAAAAAASGEAGGPSGQRS